MSDWFDTITGIQLDATSYCNAACPSCARNQRGGAVVPWLQQTHLDLDLWHRVLSEDLKGKSLRRLHFNGNWGDAIMHPDLIDIIEIFQKYHPTGQVTMPTNGSARSKDWWESLAATLNNSKWFHEVQFAIDGLADTHSLYRRKTDYNKIIENVKAFTKAGGMAAFVITVFDYNLHQIDDIVQVARDCNCIRVDIRPSHEDDIPIVGDDDKEYLILTGAAKAHMKSDDWKYKDKLSNGRKGTMPLVDRNTINKGIWHPISVSPSKCPWKNDGTVQIDPWGNLWSCCHVGNKAMHPLTAAKLEYQGIRGKNSLYDHTMQEILENEWFEKTLPESLETAPWQVCKSMCGLK